MEAEAIAATQAMMPTGESTYAAEELDTCHIVHTCMLACVLRRFGVIIDLIARLVCCDRLGLDEEWSFMGWFRALQVQTSHSAVTHKPRLVLSNIGGRLNFLFFYVALQSPQWLRKMSPRRKQVQRNDRRT